SFPINTNTLIKWMPCVNCGIYGYPMEEVNAMRRIAVFVIALLASAGLQAQTVSVAQISGTIKDQSGALLPGVEVKVTQTETGYMRTALTNEAGSYTIPNLPIGPYRLEASLSGFNTYVQSGIVLQVNSNPAIPITLAVGAISEQVEVQADAAMVETHTTSVGQVIDQARLLELPLNG